MIHQFLLKLAYWLAVFAVGTCFGIGIAVASAIPPLGAIALGIGGAAAGGHALRSMVAREVRHDVL